MQQLPRKEFQLSELDEALDNPHPLDERRQVHVAFSIALTTIDLYWDDQSVKPDAVEAIFQAWDFFARQENEDVILQYGRWGCDPDVIEREESPDDQEGRRP